MNYIDKILFARHIDSWEAFVSVLVVCTFAGAFPFLQDGRGAGPFVEGDITAILRRRSRRAPVMIKRQASMSGSL
jgi:hypothetical protein